MRRGAVPVALLGVVVAASVGAAHARQASVPAALPAIATLPRADTGWVLSWRDEFDGPAGAPPDPRTWVPDTGDGCARGICGWGNQERQTYTASGNAALTGSGQLAITARVAPPGRRCWYGPCRYTSAKLITKGTVEVGYGRVAIRAKVPVGQGLWPAFWMLGAGWPATGWPQCGELDVMEYGGGTPTVNSSSIHGPGYSGQTPFTHRTTRPTGTFADDWHVYAVERDASHIRFLVDDAVHYEVTRAQVDARGAWVFDGPMFLLLNLAVGGIFDGDPASDAVLPGTLLVDWVRVYRRG
jgi:beta-glucanase (GH16 family)